MHKLYLNYIIRYVEYNNVYKDNKYNKNKIILEKI